MNISIQVSRDAKKKDALQLIGLVMRQGAMLEALQGTEVQLSTQDDVSYTQTIDELGNFVFSALMPATYTLELQFPEGTVVIEQLSLAIQG